MYHEDIREVHIIMYPVFQLSMKPSSMPHVKLNWLLHLYSFNIDSLITVSVTHVGLRNAHVVYRI